MTKQEAISQVKKYISQALKIKEDNLFQHTSLLDLEVYGEDVPQFLEDFAKFFSIPLANIDLTRYWIGDEPFSIIPPVIRFFRNERTEDKPTITIEDLAEAVLNGYLK